MSRESDSVRAKINNFCKENDINNEVVIRLYFMERFLERVSVSSYNSNLIFKGGFLVSSMVSITTRSTKDLDATCKKIDCSADNITKVITDISEINLDDGVEFEFESIEEIIDRSNYGGYRVKIRGKLDKISMPVEIDISTNDAITPSEIKYDHKLLFGDRSISIWTYNIETVLSEKLHSILYFSTETTRMRDFFDIYILQKLRSWSIDYKLFAEAFKQTYIRRGREINFETIVSIVNNIKNDEHFERDWRNFQRQNPYASNVSWKTLLKFLEILVGYLKN